VVLRYRGSEIEVRKRRLKPILLTGMVFSGFYVAPLSADTSLDVTQLSKRAVRHDNGAGSHALYPYGFESTVGFIVFQTMGACQRSAAPLNSSG
jgi:hypothetical protein